MKGAPRPCSHPGCGRLVPFGQRCPVHPAKDKSFADSRRGSRHSRGYDAEWDRTRTLIMRRDHGLCQPCLQMEIPRTTLAVAVDHIVCKALAKLLGWPRERTDHPANLQAICRTCHNAKTAADAQAVAAYRLDGTLPHAAQG